MGIALNDVDDLQEHLLGVLRRSQHHAGEVNEVLLAIVGGILWRKTPGTPVKANEKDGEGGNVIWFRVGSERYAMLYSHEEQIIKLMRGGRHGELLHSFTNRTPLADVAQVFANLGYPAEVAAPNPRSAKRHADASAAQPAA